MFDFKSLAKGAEAMGTVGAQIVKYLDSIDQHLASLEMSINGILRDADMLQDSIAAMQLRGALNEHTKNKVDFVARDAATEAPGAGDGSK